ncbi:MAG: GNAT family N-acetyltransferase [Rubrivivax sp.]|nr:GNAT family N-acetyltransferase [Rubrivivax sp.]
MTSITVRQAVLADLDALASLFDQYRRFQGQPGDLPAASSFLRNRFEHGESVLFIAFDGESPVGFAQLYPTFSSVSLARAFILNDLFVAEAGRRKGVASALLEALEAYAWSFGSARVTLNVARDNLSAQALYRSQGWVQDQQFHMFHRFPPGR